MTTKKKHRWAILPPADAREGAPSPDDVTQTRRRLSKSGDGEQDGAASRRRARTEPELPGLDALAQQVSPSAVRPPASLGSLSREAATVPPDASPTLTSPALSEADDGVTAGVPTIIDLSSSLGGHEVTVVERSTAADLPAGATLKSPAPGQQVETLPSPPRRDDDR